MQHDAPLAPVAVESARARWVKAAVLLGALAAFVFAPIPLCPTRFYFHVPCPGCGSTRAVLALLHGDVHAALALNPVGLVAAALAVPSLAWILRGVVREGRVVDLPRWLRVVWTGVIGALFVVWIARFFGALGGPAPI